MMMPPGAPTTDLITAAIATMPVAGAGDGVELRRRPRASLRDPFLLRGDYCGREEIVVETANIVVVRGGWLFITECRVRPKWMVVVLLSDQS